MSCQSGELVAWAVTVIAPTVTCTTQGVPLKSARERLNIISTYREVGTYRGAAELCGTTHKTVKRVVERAEAGGEPPQRAARPRNFDQVQDLLRPPWPRSSGLGRWWLGGWRSRVAGSRPSGCCRSPARPVMRVRRGTFGAWWLSRKRCGKDHHRGRRPAVWSPGEYLVIDWAEAAPGLFVFCAVLAFSRWRFVRFATDQKATTTLAMIAER